MMTGDAHKFPPVSAEPDAFTDPEDTAMAISRVEAACRVVFQAFPGEAQRLLSEFWLEKGSTLTIARDWPQRVGALAMVCRRGAIFVFAPFPVIAPRHALRALIAHEFCHILIWALGRWAARALETDPAGWVSTAIPTLNMATNEAMIAPLMEHFGFNNEAIHDHRHAELLSQLATNHNPDFARLVDNVRKAAAGGDWRASAWLMSFERGARRDLIGV